MLRKIIALFLCSLFMSSIASAFEVKPFTVEEIGADKTYGLWEFNQDLVGSEAINAISLRGKAQFVDDEIFGSVLEAFEYVEGNDTAHGAFAKRSSVAHPDGAFTLEAWVKLKKNPENDDWKTAYIVDKTYVPNTHKDKYSEQGLLFDASST